MRCEDVGCPDHRGVVVTPSEQAFLVLEENHVFRTGLPHVAGHTLADGLQRQRHVHEMRHAKSTHTVAASQQEPVHHRDAIDHHCALALSAWLLRRLRHRPLRRRPLRQRASLPQHPIRPRSRGRVPRIHASGRNTHISMVGYSMVQVPFASPGAVRVARQCHWRPGQTRRQRSAARSLFAWPDPRTAAPRATRLAANRVDASPARAPPGAARAGTAGARGPAAASAWLPGPDRACAPAWTAPAPRPPAPAARAASPGSAIVWWLLKPGGWPGRGEKEIASRRLPGPGTFRKRTFSSLQKRGGALYALWVVMSYFRQSLGPPVLGLFQRSTYVII